MVRLSFFFPFLIGVKNIPGKQATLTAYHIFCSNCLMKNIIAIQFIKVITYVRLIYLNTTNPWHVTKCLLHNRFVIGTIIRSDSSIHCSFFFFFVTFLVLFSFNNTIGENKWTFQSIIWNIAVEKCFSISDSNYFTWMKKKFHSCWNQMVNG